MAANEDESRREKACNVVATGKERKVRGPGTAKASTDCPGRSGFGGRRPARLWSVDLISPGAV